METIAPDTIPSTTSVVPASISQLSLAEPSDKAKSMSIEELCQWLKDKKIASEYIECFREDDVDGSVLAVYDDEDLKELGISEARIRKKIMVQFRNIK